MPEGILDSASIDGVLRMASAEGLLRDRDDRGDRLLFTLEQYRDPMPEWHRQQILEQIVLNARIHTAKHIPFDWVEGELLGMDLIQCTKADDTVEFDDAIQISPDILEGLLLARGADPDLAKYDRIFKEEAEPILERIDAYEREHGIKFESNQFLFRGAINRKFHDSPEYKLATEWNGIQWKLKPAITVVEEFLTLSQIAESSGLRLKTPIHQQSANLINLSTHTATDDATKVFRIVTKSLGQIPICESLRDTLELARDLATIALREKIDEWLESLAGGIADRTEKIQREIRNASESLIASKRLKAAGFISGVVALPVSTVGLFNPFFGALGLALGCVAVICETEGNAIQDNVRWAGFGSR